MMMDMMAMVEGNNSAKSKDYNLKLVHPRSLTASSPWKMGGWKKCSGAMLNFGRVGSNHCSNFLRVNFCLLKASSLCTICKWDDWGEKQQEHTRHQVIQIPNAPCMEYLSTWKVKNSHMNTWKWGLVKIPIPWAIWFPKYAPYIGIFTYMNGLNRW